MGWQEGGPKSFLKAGARSSWWVGQMKDHVILTPVPRVDGAPRLVLTVRK